mgnify:CR=1 FL=1
MKNKDENIALVKDILYTTEVMQKECPEIYGLLLETPLATAGYMAGITTVDLQTYLSTIKAQLNTFRLPSIRC